MTKYISLWLLLVLSSLGAQAQTLLRVADADTGQPLGWATVSSEARKQVITTDERGLADVSALAGATDIVLRLLGYESRQLNYSDLEQSNFKMTLQATNLSLDEVVVSAGRWEQRRADTPARITSITAREVRMQNPQTAADMLGLSGEVFIQKSQLGGGSPMIRGFSTNRVLLVVDGVRMNTAIFRGGNLQNVISLDPFAIGRTEVLFGPGSVMYGSDAIGGVMRFQTLAPTLSAAKPGQWSGGAAVRYATASAEKTAHLHLNVGGRRWASLTSFSINDFGDLRMGANGPDEYLRPEYVERINGVDSIITNDDPQVQVPTGYRQYNVMQQLRFSPNERWDMRYAFHFSTTTDYSRYDRLLVYRNGLLRSAEWYYGPQEWMMNHLSVRHKGSGKAFDELSINLAQQRFGESRHDRNLNSSTLRNRTEGVQAYSLNLDFLKRWGQTQQLSYGLEAVYNQVSSEGDDKNVNTGASVPAAARYPDGATWTSLAAYAAYNRELTEKWALLAGLRYNFVGLDATFDDTYYPFPFTEANMANGALTGSAGLIFKPGNGWQWSLNLATGFRSPNVDDVGKVFDSTPGLVVVPNPDLSPEYIYNGELGIAKVVGEALRFDLSLYYSWLDNALVRRPFALGGQDSIVYDGELSGVEAIQNAARATVYGLQVGLEWKWSTHWSIRSRFNYQQGEEELDDSSLAPLRHAAPWFGATHLRYAAKRWQLEAYAVYNGTVTNENLAPEEQGKPYLYAIDDKGNPYSPGWYTLNLKGMVQLNQVLAVSLGLENITDQRYRPYSSGIAGAGRNFIASLRADF